MDLGVENIAVTSTGVFWSADELNHCRQEYVERRTSLQECGSRWAHENVQAVGRKEAGRFEQSLHRVANEPVGEAIENGCTVIAFENLMDIRERMPNARQFHEWAPLSGGNPAIPASPWGRPGVRLLSPVKCQS